MKHPPPDGTDQRTDGRSVPGGSPTLTVAPSEAPLLVAIYPAEDLNLEELEIANPRPGLTAEEIIAHCRDNLAGYKTPRHVVFGPIPKTSTGKIQKFKLRDRAEGL